MADIRKIISARIDELEISQAEAARRASMPPAQLNRFLMGHNGMGYEALRKLMRSLRLTVAPMPPSHPRRKAAARKRRKTKSKK